MKRMASAGRHALLLGCLLQASSATAQFTLFSQNTLHFGWGHDAYYTNKNNYMSQHVVNALVPNWDVVILQEVMNNHDLANLYPNPGTYLYLETPIQGQTSYQERYAFLVRTPVLGGCCTVLPSQAGNNVSIYGNPGLVYSRPPAGIVVSSNTVMETWIIDYHAIFGAVAARRAEVSRGAAAIQSLQAVPMGANGHLVARFVMGGDWNFPAADAAFTNIAANLGGAVINVQPTADSSLKRNGDMSQPYDHFLWVPASVTCANPGVVQPPGGQNRQWFRTNFSDHLGVRIDVQ